MDDIEKAFVEQRDWPRYILETLISEAHLLLPADTQQIPPSAEVVNLSSAGAGILMPMRLEKGTQVKLQIAGKDIPKLDLEAEVRWAAQSPVSTGKYPAGLKFLRLEKKMDAELQAFIETLRQLHRPSE